MNWFLFFHNVSIKTNGSYFIDIIENGSGNGFMASRTEIYYISEFIY